MALGSPLTRNDLVKIPQQYEIYQYISSETENSSAEGVIIDGCEEGSSDLFRLEVEDVGEGEDVCHMGHNTHRCVETF